MSVRFLAIPTAMFCCSKCLALKTFRGSAFSCLHNPSVANTSLKDNGRVSLGPDAGLYAWEGDEPQALVFSTGLKQVSADFEAANEGYQDLTSDYQLDSHFERALDGNVVLTAWLDIPESVGVSEFTIALGFGSSPEKASAFALDSLLAAPATPWGRHRADDSSFNNALPFTSMGPFSTPRRSQMGGYHLVWPRDLYQMVTTFLAIGDTKSALASLHSYQHIQFDRKSGDWKYGARHHSRDGFHERQILFAIAALGTESILNVWMGSLRSIRPGIPTTKPESIWATMREIRGKKM